VYAVFIYLYYIINKLLLFQFFLYKLIVYVSRSFWTVSSSSFLILITRGTTIEDAIRKTIIKIILFMRITKIFIKVKKAVKINYT
jgi:hypothetical protein